MNLLENASIIKDWLTLGVACCGVWVAWQGLKTWRRQLKGTSQFDISRKLMLKVYEIRRDIEHCRTKFRYHQLITHDNEGKPIPPEQQHYYSSKQDMWGRFDKVAATYNEIEFLLFEAEIILDKEVRQMFTPIEDVCYLLRRSIRGHLDYSHPNGMFKGDEEMYKRDTEWRRVIFGDRDDDIHKKVDDAVSAMETFIRPYIHE